MLIPSPSTQPKHNYQNLLIIRIALFIATFIIMGIAFFLNKSSGGTFQFTSNFNIFEAVFLGIGASFTLAAFKLPAALKPKDGSLQTAQNLFQAELIAGALAELIAVVGLVYLMLTQTLLVYLILCSLSIATHLLTFPDKRKWEAYAA